MSPRVNSVGAQPCGEKDPPVPFSNLQPSADQLSEADRRSHSFRAEHHARTWEAGVEIQGVGSRVLHALFLARTWEAGGT